MAIATSNSNWKEMAAEIILEEIGKEWLSSLTEKDSERVGGIANEEGINEDLHLLLLGRPGVGKSTFAGEFTGGIFKGSSGPTGGTKSSDEPGQWRHIKMVKMEEEISTKTDGSNTKKAYFVYDTVGLGDVKVDLDEMKREAKEVCQQRGHCPVFLCIGWGDRIDSNDTHIAFDVCDSLGMWENVVVVITKCDSTSEESIGIKRMKHDWKSSIAEKLESMNVEDSVIARITEKIIFYPNKEITPVSPLTCTWVSTLLQRLKDIIIQSGTNFGSTLSSAIGMIVQTIANYNALGPISCIQSSDDHQVQNVARPNDNIEFDDLSSQSSQQVQSGNEQLLQIQKKPSIKTALKILGGGAAGGGIAGGITGGIIGILTGAFTFGGGATAITGGAAIGFATGGIGAVAGGIGAVAGSIGAVAGGIGGIAVGALIVALIAYFCLKD